MTPEIRKVLKYFAFFSYPPSEDEIYTYLKKRTPKEEFRGTLASLIASGALKKAEMTGLRGIKTIKYTLGEYGIFLRKNIRFSLYSQSKLKYIKNYISILKFFPQISFVGITGTLSMMHADKDDDVDLFIITAKKRLWTARFIANSLALLLGLKRKRLVEKAKDKICLNLFFDSKSLFVPKIKQNEYVAHEVLQVKPLINKENTYERFLTANSWVFKLFPNAKNVFRNHIKPSTKPLKSHATSLGDLFEWILRSLQLAKINKNKTKEIVTKHQLWFFPDDFEKKLPKRFIK